MSKFLQKVSKLHRFNSTNFFESNEKPQEKNDQISQNEKSLKKF